MLRIRKPQNRTSIRLRHEASTSLTRMTASHAERRLVEILTLRNVMEDDVADAADIQHVEDLIVAELSVIHNATLYEPIPYQRTAISALTIAGLDDSECLTFTRFLDKAQLRRLFAALQIPDEVRILDDSNRTHIFQGEECLLFCLHRMASGTSLEEAAQHVHGRDASQWSRVWRWFIKYMVQKHRHLIVNSLPLFADCFESYNDVIISELNQLRMQFAVEHVPPYTKELCNVCAFVDCSLFTCSRAGSGPVAPGPVAPRTPEAYALQLAVYSGYKHKHAIKYEATVAPNGMIMSFHGPYSARRHDAFVTADYDLNDKLRYAQADMDVSFVVYGDRGYGNDVYVRRPHFIPSPAEKEENLLLSSVRQSIEHAFGLVKMKWGILSKLRLDARNEVDVLIPLVASLLTNAYTCMNYGLIAERFDCVPPTLEDYFNM